MKKIIFVLPDLSGGGAEKIVINMLRSLDRKKFSLGLVLFFKEGVLWDDLPKDIEVYSCIEKKKNLLFCFWNILKLLNKVTKNADIIIGGVELSTTYLAFITAKIHDCKSIGWVHIDLRSSIDKLSFLKRKIHERLISLIYRKLDGIIFVSKQAKGSFLENFSQCDSKKSEVIYNPIFLDEIKKKSSEFSVNMERNMVNIIGIGRLFSQKNFPLLIQTHKKLLKNGLKNNLFILGEGPEFKNLEKMVNQLKLSNSVKFLGYQKNPYPYLAEADILVLSSNYEGLPTVLIEAMSLGVPVVSTDCPSGPREILRSGKDGLLVKINDVNEMYDAVMRILKDESLRENLKKAGMNRAKIFDSKIIVKKFERFFLEL